MAVLSAVAALVCIARFNSAAPTAGTNYEMDAIGACFIGGASAYGGIGTVPGVVIGAIFMGVLNNGMSIMGIDANWQKAVKGLVLLAAVAFDVISKNKAANKKNQELRRLHSSIRNSREKTSSTYITGGPAGRLVPLAWEEVFGAFLWCVAFGGRR